MKGIVLSAALACALVSAAFADDVGFSFNGGGISSSGTMTIAPSGTADGYNITAITGTFSDTNDGISGPITGLYQPVSYAAPPTGTLAFTTSGFSYDDTFYPAGDSPHNCADYPFFGGDFDVYGVAFMVGNSDMADIWSDGVMPGVGLVYAAGDGTLTTVLDDPNPTGADQSMPTGVAGTFVASPEPASVLTLAGGLLFCLALVRRKRAV